MPGENLTREEAQERAAVVGRVERYDIALDLGANDDTFTADTTVRFTAVAGATTFLDLVADSVERVVLNGTVLDPEAVFADSRVRLEPLTESNTVRVVSTQRYTNAGEGLHRFVDPVDGETYLYSQFEIPDSRQVFAVFEQPDLKASFAFTVTAPAKWTVVSVQATPDPEPAGEQDGTELAIWRFEPTPVISSYVTAIIAGPYHEARSELTSRDGRTIPLGLLCRASLAPHLDAEELFAETRAGFAFFEEQFGVAYPFDTYDQIFVPEHSGGAMENVGAVTFDEDYVFTGPVPDSRRESRTITLLHELAHMWFGNLVTMRWWNDLWLNESFADYVSNLAAAEATGWTDAWATFAASDKAWALRQDQLPTTHPVAAEVRDLEDTLVNFDGITYAKGASVLKQLVAWVGREPFMQGVHDYFVKHHHGNTELPDLLGELEARSGRDLAGWSRLWLETAGVNTLRPEFELDAEGRYVRFAVRQTAVDAYPTLRPHRIAIGLYETDGGGAVVRRVRRIEIDIDGALTEVPELVGAVQPALLLLNDDDLSYAKIRLDARSLETVAAHLGGVPNALARAVLWGALWDATCDAEFPATRFAEAVLAHAGEETNSTTLRTILEQLGTVCRDFVRPEERDDLASRVATGLWTHAAAAAPGSDAQLQFATAFAHRAVTPTQLARVRGLRNGRAPLDGLIVSDELSWELLIALVAGGAAAESEIDAQLELDRTASGEKAALRARAALPTAAAKAAAWETVFGAGAVSNRDVEVLAEGFVAVHDRSLLTPYIDRFHDALLSIWETRAYSIAEQVIGGFYPSPLADATLSDATRAWLDANPDAAPTLRRLVAEPLADLERALVVQEFDRRAAEPEAERA